MTDAPTTTAATAVHVQGEAHHARVGDDAAGVETKTPAADTPPAPTIDECGCVWERIGRGNVT